MANGHGGKRDGAGRKRTRDKYEGAVTAAEQKIADKLPQLVDQLLKLAKGGYTRTEAVWKPAGLVFIEEVEELQSGDPENPKIRERVVKKPAFPDLPADKLVCVEKRTSIADADRQANIYLMDRILGKPALSVEADVTSNGETIPQVQFYLPDNGRDPAPGDPPAGGAAGDVPL